MVVLNKPYATYCTSATAKLNKRSTHFPLLVDPFYRLIILLQTYMKLIAEVILKRVL